MEQLEGQISIEEYLENKSKESLLENIGNIINKYNITNDKLKSLGNNNE